VAAAFDALEKKLFRNAVVEQVSARMAVHDEIRPLSCEVAAARTHGSGSSPAARRSANGGDTGSVGQQQIIDDLGIEERNVTCTSYNFPPFSTGEVRPMRGPGRREIGHGALRSGARAGHSEKDEFPYTIDCFRSAQLNGSSSMASVCAAR